MSPPKKNDIITALESTPSAEWQQDTLAALRAAVAEEEYAQSKNRSQRASVWQWIRNIFGAKIFVPIGVFIVLIAIFGIVNSGNPQSMWYALNRSMERVELAFAEVGGESDVVATHLEHAEERLQEMQELIQRDSMIALQLFPRVLAQEGIEVPVDNALVEKVETVLESYKISLESVEEIFENLVFSHENIEEVRTLAANIFAASQTFEQQLRETEQNADILFRAHIAAALTETEELEDATLQGVIAVANTVNSDLQLLITNEIRQELQDIEVRIGTLEKLVQEKETQVPMSLLVEAENLLLFATENFHEAERKLADKNFAAAFNALNLADSLLRQSRGFLTAEENTKAFQLKTLEMLEDMQQKILEAQQEINAVSADQAGQAAAKIERLQVRLQQAQDDLQVLQRALSQNDLQTILQTVAEIQELMAIVEDTQITTYEQERLAEAELIKAKAKIASMQAVVDTLPADEQSTLEQKRELIRIRRILVEARELFLNGEYLKAEALAWQVQEQLALL